jgi:hypothetical protein
MVNSSKFVILTFAHAPSPYRKESILPNKAGDSDTVLSKKRKRIVEVISTSFMLLAILEAGLLISVGI